MQEYEVMESGKLAPKRSEDKKHMFINVITDNQERAISSECKIAANDWVKTHPDTVGLRRPGIERWGFPVQMPIGNKSAPKRFVTTFRLTAGLPGLTKPRGFVAEPRSKGLSFAENR